jgi:hypothetical protein
MVEQHGITDPEQRRILGDVLWTYMDELIEAITPS